MLDFEKWIAERNGKNFLNNSNDFKVFIKYDDFTCLGLLQSVHYRKNGVSNTFDIYIYNKYDDDFYIIRCFSDKEKAFKAFELLTTF